MNSSPLIFMVGPIGFEPTTFTVLGLLLFLYYCIYIIFGLFLTIPTLLRYSQNRSRRHTVHGMVAQPRRDVLVVLSQGFRP